MALGVTSLSGCIGDKDDGQPIGQTVKAVSEMTRTPPPMDTGSPPPPVGGNATPTAHPFRDLNRWISTPGPVPTDSPDEPPDSGPTPDNQGPPTPTP